MSKGWKIAIIIIVIIFIVIPVLQILLVGSLFGMGVHEYNKLGEEGCCCFTDGSGWMAGAAAACGPAAAHITAPCSDAACATALQSS